MCEPIDPELLREIVRNGFKKDELEREIKRNEFTKDKHRRWLDYVAAIMVFIGLVAAIVGVFVADSALKPSFQTLLTTILGGAVGFVLKTRDK